MERDNAKVAGLLNFLTFGGGYLYLGRRTYSALGLVAAWLLAIAWAIPRWMAGEPWGLVDAALFVTGASLGYDAYESETYHGSRTAKKKPATH